MSMFEVIAEIEPPVSADLTTVSRQLTALRPVASRFLVPDNHTGRATVSSIVVADRVARLGAPAIACLNARDRNLLGLRRDLLTAQHLGVEELLLVHGDEPSVGERSGTLKVRTMVDECSAAGLRPARDDAPRAGARLEAGRRTVVRPGLVVDRRVAALA